MFEVISPNIENPILQPHQLPHFAFIDADNIYKGFSQKLKRLGIESHKVNRFNYLKILDLAHFDRSYFYSATKEIEELQDWQKEILSRNDSILKLGRLTQKGEKVKQEGVDVMLAIDATRYAFTSTMRSCTLIGGDGDFIPLIDAIRDSGCKVNILSFDNPKLGDVASKQQAAADRYTNLNGACFFESLQTNFAVRNNMPAYHSYLKSNEVVEEKINDCELTIKSIGQEFGIMVGADRPGSLYTCADLETLKVWAKLCIKKRS